MSTTVPACRNGHSPFARTGDGRCIACKAIRQARYDATTKGRTRRLRHNVKYDATIRGQLAHAKARMKYTIRHKEARIAELKEQLQYA